MYAMHGPRTSGVTGGATYWLGEERECDRVRGAKVVPVPWGDPILDGTESGPRSTARSTGSSRARVAGQYFGASSR